MANRIAGVMLILCVQGASAAFGQSWQQYATPADAGFSAAALDSVRLVADSLRSGALMIVQRGRVVAAYGDVAREFQAHSVRKSLLNAMYGSALADGKINLSTTLAALGIDDDSVLTPQEKSATLRDLISARSGIYLPAAYAGSEQDDKPRRGSFPPGTNWFYNNWDFNVAGVAYEKVTGESWYESFERRIAKPIGMEDWSVDDGYAVYDPLLSRHPAHTVRISTRDLARFGQLYIQRGKWNGRQIIPATWIDDSFALHSRLPDSSGYGYLWWVQPAGTLDSLRYPALRPLDIYVARGTGGQAVFVIPRAEMVVVHRGDTDHGRSVNGRAIWGMVERIVRARTSAPAAAAKLVALTSVPLESQLAPLAEKYAVVPANVLEEVKGDYQISPGAISRIFLWQNRPYIDVPGQGSAELFALPDGALTVRVQSGIRIVFDRDAAGRVTVMRTLLNGREFRATRVR